MTESRQSDPPVRVAYADPPYRGQARKHYKNHADFAGEVDQLELIARLMDEFPDGWALSMAARDIRELLPHCPERARLCPWIKSFCAFHQHGQPQYAWEPLVVYGGRRRRRDQPMVRDWLLYPMATGQGVVGAKPAAFCHWMFDLLNLEADDELVDLFPGSGSVAREWESWRRQPPLIALPPKRLRRSSGAMMAAIDAPTFQDD